MIPRTSFIAFISVGQDNSPALIQKYLFSPKNVTTLHGTLRLAQKKCGIYMHITVTHCEGRMDGFIASSQHEVLHNCE